VGRVPEIAGAVCGESAQRAAGASWGRRSPDVGVDERGRQPIGGEGGGGGVRIGGWTDDVRGAGAIVGVRLGAQTGVVVVAGGVGGGGGDLRPGEVVGRTLEDKVLLIV